MNDIQETGTPDRVILFFIDGLHWRAPERIHMPVFNALIKDGTYINQSYMIVPHHPTVGEYGRMHSSSFPNPVLHEGTVFISEDNRMIQEVFPESRPTAFITNTTAYASVSRGFDFLVQDPAITDRQVVMRGIDIIEEHDPAFVRIHLQTPGNEGRYLSHTNPEHAYYRNIYGSGSPYVAAVEEADRSLGILVENLKTSGKLESTLLVVTSDHGQSLHGWHPVIDEDSVRTPLLFHGQAVANGRVLEYFEHTDLAATIAGIMKVPAPSANGGAGILVREVLGCFNAKDDSRPRYLKMINQQLNRYNALRARIMIAGEKDVYYSSLITYLENELLTPEPFYHQDRFLEWSKAGTTQHLVSANAKILEQMERELQKFPGFPDINLNPVPGL